MSNKRTVFKADVDFTNGLNRIYRVSGKHANSAEQMLMMYFNKEGMYPIKIAINPIVDVISEENVFKIYDEQNNVVWKNPYITK